MSVGIKADPSGTFGELLLGGSPVVRFDSGGLTTTTSGQDYYNQANILGLVSQSGGIPTGAIIERGSNANGEYVRYADGTQICWAIRTAGSASNIVSGNIFRSDTTLWTYPASFITDPTAFSRVSSAVAFGLTSLGATATNVTSTSFGVITAISTGVIATVSVVAIGRWF